MMIMHMISLVVGVSRIWLLLLFIDIFIHHQIIVLWLMSILLPLIVTFRSLGCSTRTRVGYSGLLSIASLLMMHLIILSILSVVAIVITSLIDIEIILSVIGPTDISSSVYILNVFRLGRFIQGNFLNNY